MPHRYDDRTSADRFHRRIQLPAKCSDQLWARFVLSVPARAAAGATCRIVDGITLRDQHALVQQKSQIRENHSPQEVKRDLGVARRLPPSHGIAPTNLFFARGPCCNERWEKRRSRCAPSSPLKKWSEPFAGIRLTGKPWPGQGSDPFFNGLLALSTRKR
jgi:hypothetical protein